MTLRLEVTPDDAGQRLDVWLTTAAQMSRARAGDLIGAGCVLIDGRVERKSYRVAPGDVVEIEERTEIPPEPPEGVGVVFEDDHLLVVSKPAGVVVHRAPGVRTGTLVDALEAMGRRLAERPGSDRPGVVHRLDRDVSGLLVVAKTDATHEALTAAMKRREIDRRYLALVHGRPQTDRGKIDAPVGRNPKHRTRMAVVPEGKSAVTWFAVTERFAEASMLRVHLETGRTHQIRTHLASIGHPIVGDAAYGRDPDLARRLGLMRPFLHAYSLSFVHPVSEEPVEVESELPRDLSDVLDRLRA